MPGGVGLVWDFGGVHVGNRAWALLFVLALDGLSFSGTAIYHHDMSEPLRELRERAGLSQAQLALRSGIAQPNIAAYESGRRSPSAAMVGRLRSAMRPLPHEALERHRDQLKELAAEYGLSNVRIFGSAERGTDTTQSDLDILVTRSPNVGLLGIAEFAIAAEKLLGVPVDVVTDGGLPEGHPILRSAVAA